MKIPAAISFALLVMNSFLHAHAHESVTPAAEAFIAELSDEQKQVALVPFDHNERTEWDFFSGRHPGVMIDDLSPEAREALEALLRTGVSEEGRHKMELAMQLEPYIPAPSPYWSVMVFGEPSDTEAWGWRFMGHHISWHFTVIDGHVAASTPAFLGARPRAHPEVAGGEAPLEVEESLARQLARSLTAEQREAAFIGRPDIRFIPERTATAYRHARPGLLYPEMNDNQQKMLRELLTEYADRMEAEIAATRMAKVETDGWDEIGFVWDGSVEPLQNHYYRIQGPSFIVEYDNRNGGNHVHTVWRDFDNDFGRDLLGEHLEAHH